MNPLLIIPTYNEVLNIPHLIPEILKHLPNTHILVVDDNSPDGTADLVRELKEENKNLHLLVRPGKEGYGRAIIEGYRFALEGDFTHILQMDCDFSHPPMVLPDLLEASARADVVLGSRYIKGGGVEGWGLHRVLLSRFANTFARRMLGVPYRDQTGGFRCFKRSVLEDLSADFDQMESLGYVFLIEMSYRAYLKGYSFEEVPFVFPDRVRGQSKMDFSIITEAMMRVFKLRLEKKRTNSKPKHLKQGLE